MLPDPMTGYDGPYSVILFQSALRFAVLPDSLTALKKQPNVSIRFKVRGASRPHFHRKPNGITPFQSALRFAVLPDEANFDIGERIQSGFNPL